MSTLKITDIYMSIISFNERSKVHIKRQLLIARSDEAA